jgi:hypothetical protein
MIVRIVLYPPDGGSLVIKSRAMVSNGEHFQWVRWGTEEGELGCG